MSEFTKNYEDQVNRPYSELDKGGFDPDIWGSAKIEGRELNVYTDQELIRKLFTNPILESKPGTAEPLRIVDFGGAEGMVVDVIARQLKEKGVNTKPINLDITDKNLELMREKYPEVQGIKGSMLEMPLASNLIDYGIVRFSLPYLSHEQQKIALAEMARVLKPRGRIVILQDGAFDKRSGELHDEFFAEAVATFLNLPPEEVKKNKHFPSGEELTADAKEAGLGIVEVRELKEAEAILSAKAYASRFNLSKEQFDRLEAVFWQWKNSGKLKFKDDPDVARIERPFIYAILEKPNES